MSGFEIVGVVLGAFPILYEGAKDLRDVFQDIGTWWQFEREFEDFLMDVEKEYISFSQILEILLEPLDDIPQKDREVLQGDPDSLLWSKLRIRTALANRVQERYNGWFMRQLRDIEESLKALHRLLPIGKAYKLDSTNLESEMFRIKTSFSHDKDKLLSKIKTGNANLYGFLEKAAHLQQSRTLKPPLSEDAKAVTSFLEFQNQAKSAFKGLQRHWKCNCSCGGSHPCSVSAQGSELKLLFDDGAQCKHIKVEVEWKSETLGLKGSISAPTVMTKQEEVAVLTEQVAKKSRLKSLRRGGPKGILKLAASTLSVIPDSFQSDERDENNNLKKPSEKLKKRSRAKVTLPQQVRFVSHTLSPSTPNPDPIVGDSTPDPNPVVPGDKPHSVISDMCSALRNDCQGQYLGSLESGDTRLVLQLDSDQGPLEMESLERYLELTPHRYARLQTALAVTATVLKLGTFWIPNGWQKSSLSLLRPSDSISIPMRPYVSYAAIHTTLQDSSPPAAKAKACLLTLGILLLELLFRDTLERQPFRKTYLDDSGRPSPMTDLCTAMTWQGKVETEFGDRLAEAIRRCICCAFEPAPDLGSSAFVQAVWTTVGKPFEDFLQVYSSAPSS